MEVAGGEHHRHAQRGGQRGPDLKARERGSPQRQAKRQGEG
jgi:hypothetical protein